MSDANFLASMTFASGEIACNCDECECGPSTVPPDIQRAVQEHLKKRKLEQPIFERSQQLNIKQQRELLKRESGVSVWKLRLPRYHGDPIVEYRNSHRILFVEKMKENATIKSIGKGIIGSAAEENSRKIVDWKQGLSYFLPCSSGIACGWVNTTKEICGSDDKDGTENPASGDGNDDDIVLYTLKVSPSDLETMKKEDVSSWVVKAVELFDSIGSNGISDEMVLSSEQTAKVKQILDLVLEEK